MVEANIWKPEALACKVIRKHWPKQGYSFSMRWRRLNPARGISFRTKTNEENAASRLRYAEFVCCQFEPEDGVVIFKGSQDIVANKRLKLAVKQAWNVLGNESTRPGLEHATDKVGPHVSGVVGTSLFACYRKRLAWWPAVHNVNAPKSGEAC